jgi:hypothetical protein
MRSHHVPGVACGISGVQLPLLFCLILPSWCFLKEENTMRTAIGYIRVSSEEQADSGLGLEAQNQCVRPYCEMKGLSLATIFEDAGVSGGKALATRPAGARLMAEARKNKPVLVVAKFDRLFRSVADAAQTIADFDKKGIELVAITDHAQKGYVPEHPAGEGTGAMSKSTFWSEDPVAACIPGLSGGRDVSSVLKPRRVG